MAFAEKAGVRCAGFLVVDRIGPLEHCTRRARPIEASGPRIGSTHRALMRKILPIIADTSAVFCLCSGGSARRSQLAGEGAVCPLVCLGEASRASSLLRWWWEGLSVGERIRGAGFGWIVFAAGRWLLWAPACWRRGCLPAGMPGRSFASKLAPKVVVERAERRRADSRGGLWLDSLRRLALAFAGASLLAKLCASGRSG